MRKIKKINGYLVVKFNDRERREWEDLGSYGVIDAELYTGTLEIDRSVMEYDDADSLEVAIEQAEGLESVFDVEEQKATVTVIKETDTTTEEEEFDAQLLINGWESELKMQVKSRHHQDVDERTAAHELYGFKVALNRLGILDSEECYVRPDTFGGYDIPKPLPREPEELLAHICDEICKERIPGRTQAELDAICAKCAVERLANEADDRELHTRSAAHRGLNKLIEELRQSKDFQERRISHAEARVYLRALVAARTVTEREEKAFAAAIKDALEARPDTPTRERFENLPVSIDPEPNRRLYSFALALEVDCPMNDCHLFLNIFNMARELDAALDAAQGYAADTLRRELLKHYQELYEMYRSNYAIQSYKEAMKQ